MLGSCRQTCKEWVKQLKETQIPEELKRLGGYEDIIVNRFGLEFDTCNLGKFTSSKYGQERISIVETAYAFK